MRALPHPKGIALLLSLLVLAAVVTTTLTIAGLVVVEFKASGVADRGLEAFYGAETGLEQGLYLLRQKQKTVGELAEGTPDSPVLLASNNVGWWRTAQATEPSLTTTIRQGESAQIDLFDPTRTLSQQPSLHHLELVTDNGAANASWLEVTVAALSSGTFSLSSNRTYYSSSNIERYNTSYGCASCTGPKNVSLSGSQLSYRVTLRALYADMPNLQITAYSGATTRYDLPGRTTITAAAKAGDSRRALSVTVPQQTPQASVFDYTIFSEGNICKDLDPSQCVP